MNLVVCPTAALRHTVSCLKVDELKSSSVVCKTQLTNRQSQRKVVLSCNGGASCGACARPRLGNVIYYPSCICRWVGDRSMETTVLYLECPVIEQTWRRGLELETQKTWQSWRRSLFWSLLMQSKYLLIQTALKKYFWMRLWYGPR